ncbi:MAG: Ig-like domain-containing protein [Gemmataceae bacterium]
MFWRATAFSSTDPARVWSQSISTDGRLLELAFGVAPGGGYWHVATNEGKVFVVAQTNNFLGQYLVSGQPIGANFAIPAGDYQGVVALPGSRPYATIWIGDGPAGHGLYRQNWDYVPAIDTGLSSITLAPDGILSTKIPLLSASSEAFAVSIDWDDGQTGGASNIVASTYSLQHTFSAPGTYDIVVTLQVGDGPTRTLLFQAIVPEPPNQQPSAIEWLSGGSVPEGSDADTAVGILKALDPDLDDSHTYQLIDDADGRFYLDGSTIRVVAGADLDWSSSASHVVRVRAADAEGLFVDQDLTIAVTHFNQPPVAGVDRIAMPQGQASRIVSVLANDSDSDGGTLSVQSVSQPSHGSVQWNGGVVTYLPNSGFSGSDAFTYVVSDGQGGTATGTVYVSVAVQPTASNQNGILASTVQAAFQRWSAAGLSSAGITHLQSKSFAFADLDGNSLTKVLGNTILLDRDAVGQHWFVDGTPLLDEEFATSSSAVSLFAQAGSAAGDFVDLETVVLREMAKSLGVPPSMSPELLTGNLSAGVRYLPKLDSSFQLTPNAAWSAVDLEQLSALRLEYGFVSGGGKWFLDRANQWYSISSDGALRKYGVNTLIATLSPLVFDDPSLLTKAPVSLTDAQKTQLSQLKTTYGFVSGGGKWFLDRGNQWYSIGSDGTLRKYGANQLIATVSILVFDDPTLLSNAPVALTDAEKTQLSQLRMTLGLVSGGGKWLQDRSSQWYFISADGTLRKFGTNQLVATLSVLVFDDPTLLTRAPVTLSDAEQTQLSQLRLAYGFVSGGGKWFQDRSSQWYFISADGGLRKYGTNTLIATLSVLVFDDPALLSSAYLS